ncbi:hypothetical protein SISSUDRAFT_754594 [Sistotremastrum suecicum HHB10207 ss-3]|uniref:Uncharacterized protein n=1 Tax=Sistotremastrum suecicum HHB10207 ss-3 TaxID=1314776 RepID=A0A166DEV0_9AGAM|nr:hypothetical protein SISSUDRAFT_754594 [Sistotremastrum suecicum HHB10207 ss-3]
MIPKLSGLQRGSALLRSLKFLGISISALHLTASVIKVVSPPPHLLICDSEESEGLSSPIATRIYVHPFSNSAFLPVRRPRNKHMRKQKRRNTDDGALNR